MIIQKHFWNGKKILIILWNKLKNLGFDDKFNRLWNYYLDYCETGFSLDHTDVTQFYIKKVN